MRNDEARIESGGSGRPLYVIKSFSYGGTPIYTKGKITKQGDFETLYVLISAKIAWAED